MIRKTISRLLNKTVQEFFNDSSVRQSVCKIASDCGGSGGGLPSQFTEEYTYVEDKNGNTVFDFEQEESGDQELNVSTEYLDLYRTNTEHRSRDDYARIRHRVSRESDGFGVEFELDTDDGATIYDDIYQRGLGDAADYSENKTQYSYVTKKMLESATATMNSVISSNEPIETLIPGVSYTYNGTGVASWGLPFANTKPGSRIFIINMSDSMLTINAAIEGGIYTNGEMLDSVTLGAGESTVLLDNAIAQVVIA